MDSDTLFPYCSSAIKMLEDLKRQGSLNNNPFDVMNLFCLSNDFNLLSHN